MEITTYRSSVLLFCLFLSIFETIQEECGGELAPSFGDFHSPSFPNHYASNLNCTWTIKGPSVNDRIYLQTEAFDVNDTGSAQCGDTYVKIGDLGAPLHTYCNEMRPYHGLESMTNEVVIKFVTSATNHTSRGFIFLYHVIPGVHNATTPSPSPTPSCGGSLDHQSIGLINSPNYPEPYGQNLSCTWTITGRNPTDEIEMRFDMFQIADTTSDKSCEDNYLLIGDITDKGSQQRYCNDKRPPVLYVSKTNTLFLKLVTDEKNHTSAGFSLVYFVYETNKTLTTTTLEPSISPAAKASSHSSAGDEWKIAFGVILGGVLLFLVVDLYLCRQRRGCMYSVCRKNANRGYGNFR